MPKGYRIFDEIPLPTCGPALSGIPLLGTRISWRDARDGRPGFCSGLLLCLTSQCDLSYGGLDHVWKAISHLTRKEAAMLSQIHHRGLRQQMTPQVSGKVAP
ncbi:hypothetical protein GCM10009673_20630 [Nesterenkonia sandarakina]